MRLREYPFLVRLTEFWARMRAQFGDAYAQSVAKDYVFEKLAAARSSGRWRTGRTPSVVWRAVCDTFDVPENLR